MLNPVSKLFTESPKKTVFFFKTEYYVKNKLYCNFIIKIHVHHLYDTVFTQTVEK